MVKIEDFPHVTHIRTTYPRASKTFHCSICNRQIDLGSRYVRYVYVDNETLDRKRIRTAALCFGGCDE